MIRYVKAKEYITPLREGGSLPAVVRADDNRLYAMKFIGAGQGRKALIAELLGTEIARAAGFNVPETVFVDLDPAIGAAEPDPEIQDLLNASTGLNIGMAFLEHASSFNTIQSLKPSSRFSSNLVWLDAFLTNVDRTIRNVNMLIHRGEIWLIDFGACFYLQHNWEHFPAKSRTPFAFIKDHVLLYLAGELEEADTFLKNRLSQPFLKKLVGHIPDPWLVFEDSNGSIEDHRMTYYNYLSERLENSDIFLKEALRARAKHF